MSDTHIIYQGPEGYLLAHVVQKRLYLHAGLVGKKVPSVFKRQRAILDNFEVDLGARGIKRYYTLVKTPRQARYAKWHGFDFTGEVAVDSNGTLTAWEVMAKDIA